ncbi:MAG: hypothetical protein K2M76_07460, partial [Muribaculaceae bacterium]|nr:hypothetical protein [Muribaculaceae bacterium]
YILAGVLMAPLAGCFTGVESTPRITLRDVKREKVIVTPEMSFLTEVVPEKFADWKPGKSFYVTDDKITLALNPIYGFTGRLGGVNVKYVGSREVPSLTGKDVAELVFKTPDGTEVAYRTNSSMEELMSRDKVEVPFTIEESVVDATRNLLAGKRLWILTPAWYDMNDELITGKKFVSVTVTDVLPGNVAYPVKVTFADENGKQYRIFLSVGSDTHASRPFASLFSFENPRKKYPNITNEVWENIKSGRVKAGMTRDECRLALGSPADVDRAADYSNVMERWSYENGVYLIFQDGILVRFRR